MSDHPKVTARETIRAVSGGTAAPVDVALPRDFGARYGDGVSRGLCLGGGGLFFIAWQIAYLQTLASEGIPVDASDRMVGTSAGSFVASALAGGHLGRVRLEMSVLASLSSLFSVRTSEPNLRPSQQRALDLLMEADDSYDDTVRAIGHTALAAIPPSQRAMRHIVGLLIIEDFAKFGTDIVFRFPEEVDPEQLMSAEAVPEALAHGCPPGCR